MEKFESLPPGVTRRSQQKRISATFVWTGIVVVTCFLAVFSWQRPQLMPWHSSSCHLYDTNQDVVDTEARTLQTYNLTIGARWLNLDGGRWRPMFVCNGESPCPTLLAREGDEVEIHVVNDLGAQLSIHWSGMSHRRFGFWNDGTGGLNQYPILPRGNWTSRFDTTGHWGLNWYADHTGAGVADGVYGMIYVAPSPSRPRPYSIITRDPVELREIQDAEDDIRHVALWNSDFRTAAWKFDRIKATGQGLYCYKSILVNGKGRVFGRRPGFDTIDGEPLDEAGCLIQPGFEGESASPTESDLEVIETHGKRFVMLNLINVGFEHALKFSIDDHQFWVVASDSGFVQPQLVDVVYITNGARFTILVKLDQAAGDYAMRLASTSILQNLEGMSILRYPAKRYPVLGEPMRIPKTDEKTKICLNPDSSVPPSCTELNEESVQTYPETFPPSNTNLTLLWTAGGNTSAYIAKITEYFVNEKPWQLFRAAMEPVYFTKDAEHIEKPVQNGLPLGTVVDLIVQNTINETIPMYKHGSPTYRLASKPFNEFKYSSVAEALEAEPDLLNVEDPPRYVVHDLPPLGWLAIRWKVDLVGATMFHAVKLKYFALGMAAPLLEGIEHSVVEQIPDYAKEQPHILFEPGNDGVFG